VRLTGPGVPAVTTACSWNAKTGYFLCPVKVPSGVETSASYAITAQEMLGTAFVGVPVTGNTVNPEIIHFR
jgi:hypothetical protein